MTSSTPKQPICAMILLIQRNIDIFDTKATSSLLLGVAHSDLQVDFHIWFICAIYIYIYISHSYVAYTYDICIYIYKNTWKYTYTTYVNTIYIRRPLEHEGIIRHVLSFTQPKSSFSSSLRVYLALYAIPSCSSSHSLTATCSSCT